MCLPNNETGGFVSSAALTCYARTYITNRPIILGKSPKVVKWLRLPGYQPVRTGSELIGDFTRVQAIFDQ